MFCFLPQGAPVAVRRRLIQLKADGCFVFISLCSTLLPALMHLVLTGMVGLFKPEFSRQKGVIASCLYGFITVLLLFTLWYFVFKPASDPGLFLAGLYLSFIYWLSSYIYFHIFNMSETARRVKFLISAGWSGFNSNELLEKYPKDALEKRLGRLIGLGILELSGNKYKLRSRRFYYISELLFLFRRIIFPELAVPESRGAKP